MVSSVNDNILFVAGTHSLSRPSHTAHLLSNRNHESCVYRTKNSGRSSTFRCLLSSEAFGLSRQTGFRKFLTEVSATKHAHAAHAHVHHHCVAQLLHGCFLPFLEILRRFVDVGIVALSRAFVKRFFHVLSFFTKCFFSAIPVLCIFSDERTLPRIRLLRSLGVEGAEETGFASHYCAAPYRVGAIIACLF